KPSNRTVTHQILPANVTQALQSYRYSADYFYKRHASSPIVPMLIRLHLQTSRKPSNRTDAHQITPINVTQALQSYRSSPHYTYKGHASPPIVPLLTRFHLQTSRKPSNCSTITLL